MAPVIGWCTWCGTVIRAAAEIDPMSRAHGTVYC
jgi:hypothetical protein